MAANTAHCAQQ